MNVGAWNVRGLHFPQKQEVVRKALRDNALSLLALMETKLKPHQIEENMRKGFDTWNFVDNSAYSDKGRIIILWNNNLVELVKIGCTDQAIFCKITCKITSISFFFAAVYGLHSVVARRPLWDSISGMCSSFMGPWLIMGDFNAVLRDDERSNCITPNSRYYSQDLWECCAANGLVDAPFTGSVFTWTDRTVWSKLDRVMVNHEWLHLDYCCNASFLPITLDSDHSLCLANILKSITPKAKPFKFFNMWCGHSDFIPLVHSNWIFDGWGTEQYKLCKLLKGMKWPLKKLNSAHFGSIFEKAKRAKKEYTDSLCLLQQNPGSTQLREIMGSAKIKAEFLSRAEHSYNSQLAKSKFILNSDKCSSFFHALMKKNRKRNHIAALIKDDGTKTTSLEEVQNEFSVYYRNLLGQAAPTDCIDLNVVEAGPCVSLDMHQNLIAPFSAQEIKSALWDIGDDKSPGPDGFSSKFFKSTWNISGPNVIAAVTEFFTTGKLLKQINHTSISLLAKSASASSVADYRPISCCNVTYKIIAKLLASRLSPCLSKIINPSQVGFVNGRIMGDNIMLIQELIRKYLRKRSAPRCMIKVDLRKAYDTVSWAFLEQMLAGLKFPHQFIAWIMECVSTTSYSLNINGGLHDNFKGARGLRQGDPLSPLLFVICAEYLSRLLLKNSKLPSFQFHPKCQVLNITHVAFADDIILLSKGDIASVQILMDSLEVFKNCSGLHVSAPKSNIFCGGIDAEMKTNLANITQFSPGSFPFTYLGVPISSQKLKICEFAPLLDKIAAYMNVWTGKNLSYAGKLELIRSVVQGIEGFWLAIIPAPTGVLKTIDGMCRRFLWKGKKVRWKHCCTPKEEGGLGLKDMQAWNDSFMCKLLWRITSKKDSLWIKWVHHTYLQTRDVWGWRVNKHEDSPLIKKVLQIRDFLVENKGDTATAERDLISWTKDGRFDMAKAYNELRKREQPVLWAKTVWDAAILPKHAFTLWLAVRQRLSTKDKISYIELDPICPLCGQVSESHEHLFFTCSFSFSLWLQVKEWVGLKRRMSTMASALKWMKKEVKGKGWKTKAKRMAFAATVYYIWKARNALVFEGRRIKVEECISGVKTTVYTLIMRLYPLVFTQSKYLMEVQA